MKKDYLAGDVTKRAERVLMDWANVSDVKAETGRLRKRYPELFAGLDTEEDLTPVSPGGLAWGPLDASLLDFFHGMSAAGVATVRAWLRKAWDAPDLRHQEWFIYKLREHYELWRYRAVDAVSHIGGPVEAPRSDGPPPLNEFERLMYHFQRIVDRARHCENPECPAPYFFAVKRGQRYCSSKCSAPAQRQAKLNWWRSKGNARRKSKQRGN
jgi:hypothetical protein